jgi:predicted transcriptional regulator of viral defense system
MDAAIAHLALRQHGLLLRAQVLDVGVTDAMIDHRIRSGRWARVCAGLYRLAGVPVSWRQRALAACLVAGPGAVVSHRSAAVLWGLSGFRPGPIEITVPNGHSVRSPLARVHRTAEVSRVVRTGCHSHGLRGRSPTWPWWSGAKCWRRRWRLLEAAPEDIAPLVEPAAVILRPAA